MLGVWPFLWCGVFRGRVPWCVLGVCVLWWGGGGVAVILLWWWGCLGDVVVWGCCSGLLSCCYLLGLNRLVSPFLREAARCSGSSAPVLVFNAG